jgi:hypothetical protein
VQQAMVAAPERLLMQLGDPSALDWDTPVEE